MSPGSGVNIAGYSDTASNFRQTVTLGDTTNNVALIPYGVQQTSDGGSTTTAVAANATAVQVIKSSGGRLCKAMVTATSTGAVTFYDNSSTSSGTIIGYIPASTALGTILNFQFPAANGITANGAATNPGYSVSFV